MFKLRCTQLSVLAAVGTLVALGAFGLPANADEQHPGPVGPNEPILTTVGNKRVIAFYLPGSDRCALQMVIGDVRDPEATFVSRIRVDLEPGQMVHLDSVEQKSLNLVCGENAEKLAIVDSDEQVVSQRKTRAAKANASGF